jgi:hypothetical protein
LGNGPALGCAVGGPDEQVGTLASIDFFTRPSVSGLVPEIQVAPAPNDGLRS